MKIVYDTKKVTVLERREYIMDTDPDKGGCDLNYNNEDGTNEEKRLLKRRSSLTPYQNIKMAYSKNDIIAYKLEEDDTIHWIEDVSKNFKEKNIKKILKWSIILLSLIPFISFIATIIILFAFFDNDKPKNHKKFTVDIIEKKLVDYLYFIPIVINIIIHLFYFENQNLMNDYYWFSMFIINSLFFSIVYYFKEKEYYNLFSSLKIEVEEKFNSK